MNYSVVLILLVFVLLLGYPFETLSVLPSAVSDVSLCIIVDAKPVLFSVLPLSVVLPSIGPREFSLAFFFVVVVLSLIFAAVVPGKDASALHLIDDPVSVELSTVRPLVLAFTMDVVVYEITFV